ncbi:MAG: flagellar motor switch protein FliN [Planctomycetota bacterium]
MKGVAVADEDEDNQAADSNAPAGEAAAKGDTAAPADPPVAIGDNAGDDADADADKKLNTDEIEKLLDQASASLDEATGQAVDPAAGAKPFSFGDLEASAGDGQGQSIDLISDVEMDLRIELGRTKMKLQDVLQLRSGSVVALDKLAGDPVDVFANGKLIARGEVLVMNDNFCIRITELVAAAI